MAAHRSTLLPVRRTTPARKEGFTSKERDAESQMDYFGARYYLAALGRWGSVDTLAATFPEWSPYNYVKNQPPSNRDELGLCPKNMGGDGKTKWLTDCPPESKGRQEWNRIASGKLEDPGWVDPMILFVGPAAEGEEAVKIIEPLGKKLSQMIARWIAHAAGRGGRDQFVKFATGFANSAVREGTHVTGKYLGHEGARIFRQGADYLAITAEGKLLSYVPKAEAGWGIEAAYRLLGGK